MPRLHFIYKPKNPPRHLNRLHVSRGHVKPGYFRRNKFTKTWFNDGFFFDNFTKKRFFRKNRIKFGYLRNWRGFKQYKNVKTAPYRYPSNNVPVNPTIKNHLNYAKLNTSFSFIDLNLLKVMLIFLDKTTSNPNLLPLNQKLHEPSISSYSTKWFRFAKHLNNDYFLNFKNLKSGSTEALNYDYSTSNSNLEISHRRKKSIKNLLKYSRRLKRLGVISSTTAHLIFPFSERTFKKLFKKFVPNMKGLFKLIPKKIRRRLTTTYEEGKYSYFRGFAWPLCKLSRIETNLNVKTENPTLGSKNKYKSNIFQGFKKRNKKRNHIWRRSKFLSRFKSRRKGYYKRRRIRRFFWWKLLVSKTSAQHKKQYLRKIIGRKRFRRRSWSRNYKTKLISTRRQFRGLFRYSLLEKNREKGNRLVRHVNLFNKLNKKQKHKHIFSERRPIRFESLNNYYLFLLKKPFLFNLKLANSLNDKFRYGLKRDSSSKYNYDFLLNFYLIKFFENKTNKLVYLNVNNTHTKNNPLESDHLVIANWSSNVYKYDRKFGYRVPLFNFCLVVYYSFKNKDMELLANLIELTLARLKLWQHRNFFKFIMFLVESYVSSMFKAFNVTGFQFEVKGKISLGGNSRKKKLALRLRNTFKSNIKVRSKYMFRPLKTISGALGVRMWIYYV